MIEVRTHRSWLPTPVDCPWLAVGPVWSGRGEWRRLTGVTVAVGQRALAVRWLRRHR